MMSKPDFKVGDRIRVIDYRRIHKGLVGTIYEVGGENLFVNFDVGSGSGVFKPVEVERVKSNPASRETA